ncbi:hypothetical protein ACFX15_021859 [Malus domestica]
MNVPNVQQTFIPESRNATTVADPCTLATNQSICHAPEAWQITRFEGFTSPKGKERGTNKSAPRALSQSFPSHEIKSELLPRLEGLGPVY